MSNKYNWPTITNVFQAPKNDGPTTIWALWFFISRGLIVLAALKLISLVV